MSNTSYGSRFAPNAAAIASAVAFALGAPGIRAQQSSTDAAARQVETEFSFDIGAQSLATALSRFGDITGFQLVYEAGLAENKRSAEVSGSLRAREALARILAGTGLEFRFTDARTVVIQSARDRSTTRVLGPVRVEGANQNSPKRGEGVAQLGGVRGGQDQEERGLRPVVAAVAAGAPTAIEDIPRSVSVLTQTQMEAQDIQDFGEAIRRLPGLSMIQRGPGTSTDAVNATGSISTRGFEIRNVQVDGGAPRAMDIINNGLFGLSSFERLELVRGPNGVFSGTESPGGSINLVRKRPGGAPMLNVAATAGSFDRYQSSIDWSTPSVFGTPIALRSVVSYEDQKFKWDNDHLKRTSLYAIADMPLGERARFEVGAQYQDIRQDGFYQGSYRYYDGPNLALPFYFNYTPEWSYVDAENYELFSRFYVRLLEDWNFDVGLTYSSTDKRSLDSVINGAVYLLSTTNEPYHWCWNGMCAPAATSFFARENFNGSDNLGVDFRITGTFRTWGLEHTVFFGGDYNEQISVYTELSRDDPAWPKLFTLADFAGLPHFPASRAVEGNFTRADTGFKNSSSSWGLIVSDVISWRERVFLTLSSRLQDQESSGGAVVRRRFDGSPVDIRLDETDNGNVNRAQSWRPSSALAVKPLRAMTVYGSHSEGSRDQSTLFTRDGQQLKPAIYENTELGLKYGQWGWLLALSSYKLKENNVATAIPGSIGQCGPTPTSPCYALGGVSIESKGYDVELSGRLFDQLDVQLSYTTNEATRVSTDLPVETRSPETLGKLFVNWDVPWVAGLSANVGAVYTGRIFERGTRTIYDPDTFEIIDEFPFDFDEPSTLIWDVGVDYAINGQLSVNLFVENVADTEYYSTVSSYTNHIGNPRTAMLKVNWRDGGDRTGLTKSPTTGLAPFGDAADWYGSLDFGQQASEDWEAESSGNGPSGKPIQWTFETEPTAAFAARLGYHLNDHWRTEFELGWRQHGFGKVGGNDTAPYGLCAVDNVTSFVGTPQDRLTHCYDPQGEAVYWSFLFNAIRDFRAPDARLRPFLGVGLGATRASVDFSGRFDGYTDSVFRDWHQTTNGTPLPDYMPIAPGEKVLGSDASWDLSLQLIAGLSWRLTDQATIDASYKYTGDALDIRTANLTDYYPREYLPEPPYPNEPNRLVGAGLPQIGSFKGDLNSHTFSVGLRWSFGLRK